MTELTRLLSDPATAPLLAMPLRSLPEPPLKRPVRRKLERQAKRAETLGDLVTLAVEGRLDADLVDAVLARVRAAREHLPEIAWDLPDDPDALTAYDWAETHGLTELLSLPLDELFALCDPAALRWSTDLSASRLTADQLFAWGRTMKWTDPFRAATVAALRHLQRAAANARDPAAEARRAVPPAEPTMRAAWLRVRELARRLDAPRLAIHPTTVQFELTDDDHLHVVGHPAWSSRLATRVALQGPDLPLPRLDIERILLASTLIIVLDLLADQEHAVHEALRRELTVPRWQRALRRIDAMLQLPELPGSEDKRELGWRIRDTIDGVRIEPVQFRRKKTGVGYVTRAVSVLDIPEALLAEPVDRAVVTALAPWRVAPGFAIHQVVARLVGHPRVMDANGAPLAVRRSRLTLRVELDALRRPRVQACIDGEPRDHGALAAALKTHWAQDLLIEPGPGVLRVVPVRSNAVPFLAHALPRMGDLPAEATPALLQRLDALGELVELDLPPKLAGDVVEGDARPLIRLRWDGSALAVDVRLRPLPDAPPVIPGEGHAELRVARGGRRVRVRRALASEPSMVHAVIGSLPLERAVEQGPFSWVLPDLEGALELVEALQAQADAFQVEWQGELLRVGRPLDAPQLSLSVAPGRDWFGLSGAAGKGPGGVDLDEVLATLDEGGSYVRVKGGAYARIADTLKEPLGALAAFARANDGLRVSALHASLLEALEGAGARLDAPQAWRALAHRMAEARTLEPPLPDGLEATLRGYQAEGYRWLARLAHWAPGAVLADDMGLGKTLQAIALLLRRRDEGPALVVAPTSVVFNWERELRRFAPTLRVHVYHGAGREEILHAATPGAVLLTSWGVLQRDAAALSERRFATAVLDEAQAIKNPAAQRSVAAFGLGAGFTLALTGTPVENHATDLWSLMRAVAPGLLGGLTSFQRRFAGAVESGDASARAALATLVRPFVLRRTKRQVAADLPARTEIVVPVQLSPDERALYDQVRLEAVARLSSGGDPARQRFQILAALTRLRQLACHPRLDDPGSPVPSSKLVRLRQMLADAREGGHQALVFSQFVEHLKLVREALEADGLRLRWLDGSSTPEQRRREVDAFQAGDGDVFLLSLKAGGTGLNLTAATYVFHLDPWWNPAAEDQATDRAHRIGQTDPVTVYRLVSRGTIEDAILEMHEAKRTLAADLLAGTGAATPLDVHELLALLSSGSPAGLPGPAEPIGVHGSIVREPEWDPDDESARPRRPSEERGEPPAESSDGATSMPAARPAPASPEVVRDGPAVARAPDGREAPAGPETPADEEAPADRRSAAARGAAPQSGLDLPGLVARCKARLGEELAQGRLTPPTVRNYVNALDRFVAHEVERGPPRDGDDLEARWRDFFRHAATATDRVFGRPAFRRLLEIANSA